MKNLIALLVLSMPIMAKASTDYQCKFTKSYDEDKGLHKENFSSSFIVDGDNAYITGNNGSEKVNIVPSKAGVTFVEVTAVGSVQVTAIDNSGKAVHSRHTFLLRDGLVPSQFYGKCTKRY